MKGIARDAVYFIMTMLPFAYLANSFDGDEMQKISAAGATAVIIKWIEVTYQKRKSVKDSHN